MRQVVLAMQDEKLAARKKLVLPLPDYERTITKTIKANKRKQKAEKEVAQLGQQVQQSVLPLVVHNQYGSNMNLLQMAIPHDVNVDELARWMGVTGLSIEQLMGREAIKEAKVIDEWQWQYIYGRSLCNPTNVKQLRMQMYKLHEYYMSFCRQHELEQYISVQGRDRHYFHGDDIIFVQFSEVHQLLYMDALDKSLKSCYCL